jgi:hypothetical protein
MVKLARCTTTHRKYVLEKSFPARAGGGAPPAGPTASPPRRGGAAAEGADG